MTEKQYHLIEKAEDEYVNYIDNLLTEDKHTIIAMSDKTTFFAQMLSHLKEREISSSQLDALNQTNEPLFSLYRCYMDNNEDYLQYSRAAVKVLYQHTKEIKNQNQM